MLDTATVRLSLIVVALTMLVLFYGDTYRRTRAPFCAWWCGALAFFVAGSAAFILDATAAQRVANGTGNVLVTGGFAASWAAARTLRDLRPRWWQLFLAPVIVLAASLLTGPAPTPWSGGAVYLGSLAVLTALTAREMWCAGREVATPAQWVALAAGIFSAYCLGRWGTFLSLGPEHRVFDVAFGGQVATLLLLPVLVVTSAGMSSLSHEQRASELSVRATTDGLTGLLNRGEFLRRAAAALRTARRHGSSTAVMIADLDHFKQLNDTFGHRVGDEALQAFAGACEAVLRPGDVAGRLGGEEFAFLLPDTDAQQAERIADAVSNRVRLHGRRTGCGLTVSFGIAVAPDGDVEQGIELADIALYEAKRAGRDRAVLYRGA